MLMGRKIWYLNRQVEIASNMITPQVYYIFFQHKLNLFPT